MTNKYPEGTICFYSSRAEYGEFSNFASYKVKLDNITWETSEHYFQANKFIGTKYYTKVRNAKGPMAAANIGRDRSLPLRRDWENVKENIMYIVLKAKFSQHATLRALLLSTGDRMLVEHTANDIYWGDGGGPGKGKNRLGKLLMRLREEFRKEDNENNDK
jgi:N-glycosidase YbiA